jgi:hypothetical protein
LWQFWQLQKNKIVLQIFFKGNFYRMFFTKWQKLATEKITGLE